MATSVEGTRSSARKPRTKPVRTVVVLNTFATLDGSTLTMVEIVERGPKSVHGSLYYVSAMASDYGKAFLWQGIGPKADSCYHVNLGDKDNTPSCECPGHLAHGHKTVCRHIACTRALLEAGKLS